MNLPSDNSPFKELAKCLTALTFTYGTLGLPLLVLTIATTRLFYKGDEALACGLAAGLAVPVLYVSMLTSRKVGTWFVLNWGKPYVEATRET